VLAYSHKRRGQCYVTLFEFSGLIFETSKAKQFSFDEQIDRGDY